MTHKSTKYSKVTKYRDLSIKSLLVYRVNGAFEGKASSLERTLIIVFTSIPFRLSHVSHLPGPM